MCTWGVFNPLPIVHTHREPLANSPAESPIFPSSPSRNRLEANCYTNPSAPPPPYPPFITEEPDENDYWNSSRSRWFLLSSSLTVFLPAQKPRPLMRELVIHFHIVAWIQTMFLKSATWWCFCISQKKVFLRQFLKILTSQTNFTQVPFVTNSMCAASSVNSVFNIKTIGDNNIEYLNVLSRTI